jgi:hypothetical protein
VGGGVVRTFTRSKVGNDVADAATDVGKGMVADAAGNIGGPAGAIVGTVLQREGVGPEAAVQVAPGIIVAPDSPHISTMARATGAAGRVASAVSAAEQVGGAVEGTANAGADKLDQLTRVASDLAAKADALAAAGDALGAKQFAARARQVAQTVQDAQAQEPAVADSLRNAGAVASGAITGAVEGAAAGGAAGGARQSLGATMKKNAVPIALTTAAVIGAVAFTRGGGGGSRTWR